MKAVEWERLEISSRKQAEEIKKRWQEHTEILYKKDLNDPDKILQARTLEWGSRGSSQHRDQTQVSCIAGRFFNVLAIRDATYSYNRHGN